MRSRSSLATGQHPQAGRTFITGIAQTG